MFSSQRNPEKIENRYSNCSAHTTFIQLGGNTNKLIFDVFSMVSTTLQVYDSNGKRISKCLKNV